jgi:NAD(P)-dependent dehydrogenase (short-subunit alcohol dehydrogenase family)
MTTVGNPPLALVTGAASGIGRATARRLVADGFHVVAMDRDAEGLDKLAADDPRTTSTQVIDLARLEGIETRFAAMLDEFGTPAAVVNAAGIALVATVLENDLAAWQRVIDVNLTAPMLVCRTVIPAMISAGGGTIVNVASAASFRGVRGRAAYCAAKHGLVGLTRAVTADHAKDGIRANAICPGTIETGYTQAVLAVSEDPQATREFMTQRQLIGRMGTPEEVADAIAFMVSPQASFLYGASIVLDGGRSVL